MRQRGAEFPHHIDAIDVCEIGLQLPQFFALFVGALAFGYIHGDTDILTDFLRGMVMSYATQESDGAVGTANPKLYVIIRAFADRILKFRSQGQFVFCKNGVVETVERNSTLAGVEAI